MAYVGNTPAEAYISISSQTFTTINGTGYVLSSSVTNSEDIALFLNNVRQKPSTYTATGTALTMGTATTTLDALYCVYLGKALQTVNPPAGSVGTTSIADDAVTYAKIQDTTTANRVIGAATAGVVSEVQVATDMIADDAVTIAKTDLISTATDASVTAKGSSGVSDGYITLNCDQNTHGIKLKSPPHSAGQSYTLTFPITAPGTDKFIQTTAAGQLSFATVTETDLTPVNQDILTLALRQSIDNNSAKYNLPNAAITHFESDADYDSGGSTDISRNASEYISAATFVSGAYTSDANTVALLHFDGNFTDSSSNATTFTGQNSIATSTVQKKFGTQSALFDGVNQYISTGDLSGLSSPAAPGTGDFTVDYWLYLDEAWSTNRRHFSFGNNGDPATGSANSGLTGSWSGATSWNWYNGGNAGLSGLTEYAYNQWDHYATMKKSGTLYLYINGVQIGSDTLGAFDQLSGDANAFLGIRSGSTTEWMKGYIDEWRYSDNARYSTPGNGSTAFTPNENSTTVSATGTALGTTNVPTAPVTSVSGVILMKNAYGTNTLGTDVKVYFTADNSNWTEASSYTSSGTFSTGVTQITLGQTTVTSGSDVRWKIVFANQSASSKEAYIYGMGLNY